MVVGDLGKHPTMPPQSFWSKVHRRFNLLLCAGWSIGSIRGLGREASVVLFHCRTVFLLSYHITLHL